MLTYLTHFPFMTQTQHNMPTLMIQHIMFCQEHILPRLGRKHFSLLLAAIASSSKVVFAELTKKSALISEREREHLTHACHGKHITGEYKCINISNLFTASFQAQLFSFAILFSFQAKFFSSFANLFIFQPSFFVLLQTCLAFRPRFFLLQQTCLVFRPIFFLLQTG